MAMFNNAILTAKGNELIVEAAAGCQIEFTRLVAGSGLYDGTEELTSMTSLKKQQQEFQFMRYEKITEKSMLLVSMLSNEGLINGYRMTEVGVYGKLKGSDKEILCSITTAATDGADFWPPYNGIAPARMLLRYHITISPDATPCITVSDNMVLAEIAAEANRANAAELALSDEISVLKKPEFEEAAKRENVKTGEELPILFGKIRKWFADLNPISFSGKYIDLSGVPTKLSDFENDSNFASTMSPVFTGAPKAPTPEMSANDTQIATTAFVKAIIAMLVNDAPETLDTLGEVAAALAENRTFVDALNDAIGKKVDKVSGKGLSSNDYTTDEKNKLKWIASGAEVNVQSDWNVVDTASDAFIKNKPESMPASDVHSWAKADKKPSYSKSEVGLENVPNVSTNDQTPTFEQAEKRENIVSGEKLSISLGKIMKWFADLSVTAFDGIASKWRTARNINGMSVDGSENRANYGTCQTAAETAAKVVACIGYALITGAEIAVKFTVTNTAANPTLNVNGTGSKPIYYRGAAIYAGYLAANRTYIFRYNGTQYDLVGDVNTNTTYGLATASTRGLVKIGYTENGKNYPVELSNEQMYVNVPWTDTNTWKANTADSEGYVPAGKNHANQVWKTDADGVPGWRADENTTYANFVKSGTGAKAGLVPAPSTTAGATKYLREDGTWVTPPDTNTTYNNMTAASTSTAGKSGLVPAPSAGAANRYLRSDGTWAVPPDNNTTYADMKGATASAAGTHGLVPAPAGGSQSKYLRGDGTWQTPPNTTYGAATQSANGLMSAADKKKLDGVETGANKIVITNNYLANVSGTAADAMLAKELRGDVDALNSKLDDALKVIPLSFNKNSKITDYSYLYKIGNIHIMTVLFVTNESIHDEDLFILPEKTTINIGACLLTSRVGEPAQLAIHDKVIHVANPIQSGSTYGGMLIF